jgi:hypothetical protein
MSQSKSAPNRAPLSRRSRVRGLNATGGVSKPETFSEAKKQRLIAAARSKCQNTLRLLNNGDIDAAIESFHECSEETKKYLQYSVDMQKKHDEGPVDAGN